MTTFFIKDFLCKSYEIEYFFVFKGIMFYAPRIFWAHQEEGKLEQMTKGVREARKKLREIEEGKKKEIERNCVDNVMNYINMKKGGHWQYGVSYLIAQVSSIDNHFPTWLDIIFLELIW